MRDREVRFVAARNRIEIRPLVPDFCRRVVAPRRVGRWEVEHVEFVAGLGIAVPDGIRDRRVTTEGRLDRMGTNADRRISIRAPYYIAPVFFDANPANR